MSSRVTYKMLTLLVQQEAKSRNCYDGALDGDVGPKTRAAVKHMQTYFPAYVDAAEFARRSDKRQVVTIAQCMFRVAGMQVGEVDGYAGPQTNFCYDVYTKKVDPLFREKLPAPATRDESSIQQQWPRQKDMVSYFGAPGTNLTSVLVPFPMRIAWNTAQTVRAFQCNERVHDSLSRIFKRIEAAYSYEDIVKHGFDLFGGCFNNRTMRGGTKLSTHACAIAVDIDPTRNGLYQTSGTKDRRGNKSVPAYLSKPECREFIRCWEAEGWINLGVERDFDWMHFQAARL